jgi:hypothetical protein
VADDKNQFTFSINSDVAAQQLNKTADSIMGDLKTQMSSLVDRTFQFMRARVSESKLTDKQRDLYIKALKVHSVSENIHVIDLDESARKFEEGTPEIPMATAEWLLKPNAKLKRAKDGSTYKVIPLPMSKGKKITGGGRDDLASMVKGALRENKLSLGKIEKDASGSPKLGVLHKVKMNAPFTQSQAPSLYSKPRSPEDAAKTGFKPHGGHFLLKGLAITQRMEGGKVKREAVVFRIASSKHPMEHRWMYPKQDGLKNFEAGLEFAQQLWPNLLKELEEKYSAGA